MLLLVTAIISSMLLAAVEYATAQALRGITNAIQGSTENQLFFNWKLNRTQILGTFAFLGLLRGIFVFYSSWMPNVVQNIFLFRMKGLLLFELLKSKSDRLINQAEVHFQTTETFDKSAFFLNVLANFISNGVILVAMFGILLSLSRESTLIALACFAAIGAILYKINTIVSRLTRKEIDPLRQCNQTLNRVLNNWLLVRILRTEQKEFGQMIGLNIYASSLRNRAVGASTIGGVLPFVLGTFMISILIESHYRHQVSDSSFIVFLYLLFRLTQKISEMAFNYGHLTRSYGYLAEAKEALGSQDALAVRAVANYSKYIKIISRPREPRIFYSALEPGTKVVPKDSPAMPPKIEIIDLCFGYPGKELIFDHLNLTIESGEQIGIIGSSGQGKSTLLALIMGVLTPTLGRVLINGEPANTVLDQGLIPLGYAGPIPFLFREKLKQNLDYGSTHLSTKEDYRRALAFASAEAFINIDEGDLDLELNDNGEGLSAGQKQRLSLARAVLMNPALLVLDEVTANLDNKTEAEITARLNHLKGKSTVVIVTHRIHVLNNADRVIDLKDLQKPNKSAA